MQVNFMDAFLSCKYLSNVPRFNKAAELGDPKAQFNIAVMHEDGEGADRVRVLQEDVQFLYIKY